jgi:hypothetical protein
MHSYVPFNMPPALTKLADPLAGMERAGLEERAAT